MGSHDHLVNATPTQQRGKKRGLSEHEARQNSKRRVEVSTQLREENT